MLAMQTDLKTQFVGERNLHNKCLAALSSTAQSILRQHLTDVVLREGTVLWEPGRPVDDVYFPISGLLSVVFVMTDGACVEVGSIGREACAGSVLNSAQSDFPTLGMVLIGGDFTRIPGAELLRVARESDEVKMLLTFAGDWMTMQAQQLAACNAVHSADRRFCRWLVQSSRRMETVTLHATQESIASILGIRRTTVTLIAQTLQQNGIIQYRRGKVSVVDMARLQSCACDCLNAVDRRYWPSARLAEAQTQGRTIERYARE